MQDETEKFQISPTQRKKFTVPDDSSEGFIDVSTADDKDPDAWLFHQNSTKLDIMKQCHQKDKR